MRCFYVRPKAYRTVCCLPKISGSESALGAETSFFAAAAVGTTSQFLSGKEVDADYTILQAEELSENMALWQKIAESGIITDVYAMYDYVNFLCAWNTYYVDNSTDENGNTVPGYYLYPSDAEHYIYTDGAQWNYGYQEG